MNELSEKRLLQITNLFTPIICAIIVILFIPDTIDVSQVFSSGEYPKLLNPAPITFAIWAPIFFFLTLFYVYQASDLFREDDLDRDMTFVREVHVFFLLSSLATTTWFIFWVNQMIWPSVGAMFAYLVTVHTAYIRLGINKRNRSLLEHAYITVGWSLYAGWITVATIVNTTTGLVSIGFTSPVVGEVGWSVFILLMALAIYLGVLVQRNDYLYPMVGVWALIGIALHGLDSGTYSNPYVTGLAILGALILGFADLLWLYQQYSKGNAPIVNRILTRTASNV